MARIQTVVGDKPPPSKHSVMSEVIEDEEVKQSHRSKDGSDEKPESDHPPEE